MHPPVRERGKGVRGADWAPAERWDATPSVLRSDPSRSWMAHSHSSKAARRPQWDGHWKVTATALVKLLVTFGFTSRNQSWNRQVSPGCTATKLLGCGTRVRSTGIETAP